MFYGMCYEFQGGATSLLESSLVSLVATGAGDLSSNVVEKASLLTTPSVQAHQRSVECW